jgi:hypothetical protein
MRLAMRDWLKLAEQLEERQAPEANRSDRVETPAASPIRSIHPIRPELPSLAASLDGLPERIVKGLARLTEMPAPKLECPERWPGVVADALWLANSGHAKSALALGWSELEVFGWAPAIWPKIDMDYHGLATHVEGKRVLLFEGDRAWIGEPPYRSCIRRDLMEIRQFLWEPVR